MTMPQFVPRLSQREILEYRGGRLGIAAVPGAGKTHTLSALAAQIIASGLLDQGQEVLIVTLVNSAVENFDARISQYIQARGLIPRLGYRVRTLHGLAHDIVRENPPLVGLDKQFSILDDLASSTIVREVTRRWVGNHPEVLDAYLQPGLSATQIRRIRAKDWPDLVEALAGSFIRAAKDQTRSPSDVRQEQKLRLARFPLMQMAAEIYDEYQRALAHRGAVDFDDLVRLAAEMLRVSPDLQVRLRQRWPYLLEDEAQDSSRLQQLILEQLAGKSGNWVRVGDPNQAIFESFTTANPQLLRQFIRQNPHVDMPESGRSQPSIMALANQLTEWTVRSHPTIEIRDALAPPLMQPTPEGDPQPNPPDEPDGVVAQLEPRTPDEEVREVLASLQTWLPTHGENTVAVLSATNDHAAKIVRGLQGRGIPYVELLKSTSPTRAVAGALTHVLVHLNNPASASRLAQAYRIWRKDWRTDLARQHLYTRSAETLSRLELVEDFLSPNSAGARQAWEDKASVLLGALDSDASAGWPQVLEELHGFRAIALAWHGAVLLPVDQLILTIAHDVFRDAADLALAHKLALAMRQVAAENPRWRLPDFAPSLREIARNERRFIGFSRDDTGFNPEAHKGVVAVSTVHKAKGLEWDRVYLMSANTYDFPSAAPEDRFISEKWFVRDRLNLEAETLAQQEVLEASGSEAAYEEGSATKRARIAYARERLRLLYVAITRARRELIISTNSGRRGDARPAVAAAALQTFLKKESS
jgi:DNA helicase-2/ATP-dependent DNA helicase PcrA